MISEMRVYLAGPIQHDDNPNRWRQDIIESNNYNNLEFANPLDLEQFDKEEVRPKDIVHTDLDAIEHCDAILVRWKDDIQMAGTPMEMFFAQGAGVSVVTWYEGEMEDLSPWVKYHTNSFVSSGREALIELNRLK